VLYFGSDTYIGRGFTKFAMRPGGMDAVLQRIKDVMHDNPFVITTMNGTRDGSPAPH